MRKTYDQLQRELLSKTKSEENLKKRARSLKEQLLEYRSRQKSLIIQYERIIREWRKMYEDLIGNGWKIVFAKIILYYKKVRGEK